MLQTEAEAKGPAVLKKAEKELADCTKRLQQLDLLQPSWLRFDAIRCSGQHRWHSCWLVMCCIVPVVASFDTAGLPAVLLGPWITGVKSPKAAIAPSGCANEGRAGAQDALLSPFHSHDPRCKISRPTTPGWCRTRELPAAEAKVEELSREVHRQSEHLDHLQDAAAEKGRASKVCHAVC